MTKNEWSTLRNVIEARYYPGYWTVHKDILNMLMEIGYIRKLEGENTYCVTLDGLEAYERANNV